MGIKSTLDMISNFFIHSHFYLSEKALTSVAGVTYFQQQAKHWFLFLKIFSGVSFYLYTLFYNCIFIFVLS